MCQSNQTTRILCSDREVADRLRQQLQVVAPDCEVLSAPGDCSRAPFCRWLGEQQLGPAGWVYAALVEATEVLEQTRHSFKSRELGQLRQRLKVLLEKLSENSE